MYRSAVLSNLSSTWWCDKHAADLRCTLQHQADEYTFFRLYMYLFDASDSI